MSMTADDRDRFYELLAALRDDRLSSEEHAELESTVLASFEARQLFVRTSFLHASLLWTNQCSRHAGYPLGGDEHHVECDDYTSAVPKVSLPLFGGLRRLVAMPLARSILVVALLFYGTFSLLVWQMSQYQLAAISKSSQAAPPIARLLSGKDCRWSAHQAPLPDGAPLTAETLRLESGNAQIALTDGAHVVLTGPAEFSLVSANAVELKRGRLAARVPSQAIGFSVRTPIATIIDLGTEFGVKVETDGTTDVHVLQGQVELKKLADSKESALRTRKLSAGDAIRVVAGSRQVVHIPFDDTEGFSAVPSAASLQRKVPSGEAISTIWLGNLFDDPRHTSLAKAIETDTFCATPEIEDLGVERVLYGGDGVKRINPRVWFDATNLGWEDLVLGKVSNDAWGAIEGQPTTGICTRGRLLNRTDAKIEEGIGASLDVVVTFDLDELRAAGGPQQGRQFEFVCDRAGINDNGAGDNRASVQMVVLVSDAHGLRTASVNGAAVQVAERAGIWSVTSPIGEPLHADGRFAEFRVPIPADAKYLTLLTTSAGDGGLADFTVWSGARLEVQK